MTIKHFFFPYFEWNTLHLIHSKIQMHSARPGYVKDIIA